jgi:hypothetical protein
MPFFGIFDILKTRCNSKNFKSSRLVLLRNGDYSRFQMLFYNGGGAGGFQKLVKMAQF